MRKLIAAGILSAAMAGPSGLLAEEAMTDAERTTLHEEIRAYLLENPEIIMEMIAILDAQKEADAAATDLDLVAQNSQSIFDDGFSHVAGNPDGAFTVVEFVDYQCGYCRRAHPEVQELIETDGDIRLIVKEMPILGPGSELAARAAISTLISEGGEAYEKLNHAFMGMQGQIDDASLDATLVEVGLDPSEIRAGMQDDEVTRRLAETQRLARDLQISGTPTFVIGNRMVRGYMPLDGMEQLVTEPVSYTHLTLPTKIV